MSGEPATVVGSVRPGDLYCVKCYQVREAEDLDRMLWCEFCLAEARRVASWFGWGLGTVLAAALALWIWLVQQPSDLVIGGWIATVVAALYLGGRVGREVAFGVLRFRNRPN